MDNNGTLMVRVMASLEICNLPAQCASRVSFSEEERQRQRDFEREAAEERQREAQREQDQDEL